MNAHSPMEPLDERWADLADLVLSLSRELHTHGIQDDRVIVVAGSERNVIRYIDRNPGSTAGEVAHATGLQRSNLSAALRSLEEKGLVERSHSAADGRGVLLYPTALAGTNLTLLRAEWARMLSRAAPEGITADDATLTRAVELLAALELGLVAERL